MSRNVQYAARDDILGIKYVNSIARCTDRLSVLEPRMTDKLQLTAANMTIDGIAKSE